MQENPPYENKHEYIYYICGVECGIMDKSESGERGFRKWINGGRSIRKEEGRRGGKKREECRLDSAGVASYNRRREDVGERKSCIRL